MVGPLSKPSYQSEFVLSKKKKACPDVKDLKEAVDYQSRPATATTMPSMAPIILTPAALSWAAPGAAADDEVAAAWGPERMVVDVTLPLTA